MTWYGDLTPFRYAPSYKGDGILSVGWLDAPHSYRRGPVTRKELVAIKQLVAKSWQPFIVMGSHECTLCPRRKRRVRHARPGHPGGFLGAYNLFVPDPSLELLYVAPELVIHYIQTHRYQPPRVFLDAILACDPDAADFTAKCERIWGRLWRAGVPLHLRPGDLPPGVSHKYVELLREVLPTASRFAVVARPPYPLHQPELQAAAHALGLSLSFVYVNGRRDFEAALIRAKNGGSAGIIATIDTVTFTHRRALMRLALKHRLPSICWTREYVEEGGLMAYSPNNALVEQPTKFELVINLKTAKALGLTIPPSVLARADEVIE